MSHFVSRPTPAQKRPLPTGPATTIASDSTSKDDSPRCCSLDEETAKLFGQVIGMFICNATFKFLVFFGEKSLAHKTPYTSRSPHLLPKTPRCPTSHRGHHPERRRTRRSRRTFVEVGEARPCLTLIEVLSKILRLRGVPLRSGTKLNRA